MVLFALLGEKMSAVLAEVLLILKFPSGFDVSGG